MSHPHSRVPQSLNERNVGFEVLDLAFHMERHLLYTCNTSPSSCFQTINNCQNFVSSSEETFASALYIKQQSVSCNTIYRSAIAKRPHEESLAREFICDPRISLQQPQRATYVNLWLNAWKNRPGMSLNCFPHLCKVRKLSLMFRSSCSASIDVSGSVIHDSCHLIQSEVVVHKSRYGWKSLISLLSLSYCEVALWRMEVVLTW